MCGINCCNAVVGITTFNNWELIIFAFQLKSVKGENAELSRSVGKALKSLEKLSMEREAMTVQLQQQAV